MSDRTELQSNGKTADPSEYDHHHWHICCLWPWWLFTQTVCHDWANFSLTFVTIIWNLKMLVWIHTFSISVICGIRIFQWNKEVDLEQEQQHCWAVMLIPIWQSALCKKQQLNKNIQINSTDCKFCKSSHVILCYNYLEYNNIQPIIYWYCEC